MTVKNLIESHKLFSLERQARDQYLAETYGITQEDFYHIRADTKKRDVIGRVLRAAQRLHQRLLERRADPSIIPAQFTTTTLAALVDDGTYSGGNFRQLCSVVNRAIRRQYEPEKETLMKHGADVPYIHLLRQNLGIYEGTLEEAMVRCEAIEVSVGDLLKDIRIPFEIGELEAMLLGVYFARGNLVGKPLTAMEIWGDKDDFEFYRNVVSPAIKKAHNFDAKVIDGNTKSGSGDRFSYNVPAIIFSSQAIATWLNGFWGLPSPRENVQIPDFLKEEERFGFFKGIVASDARLYVDGDHPRMQISSIDESYIRSAKVLSEQLGFSPQVRKVEAGNYHLLDFSKSEMVDMLRMGIFINPHHQKVAAPLTRFIVDTPEKMRFNRDELRLMAFLYNCSVAPDSIAAYFGLSTDNDNLSHFIDCARMSGFKVFDRTQKQCYRRDINDVLKTYDREIPPRPSPQ
jgi:hypothetical protein